MDLTAAGIRRGETGRTWQGIDITAKGRHWAYPPSELERMDAEGRIHWPQKEGGMPALKRYFDERQGIPAQETGTDIQLIRNVDPRRTATELRREAAELRAKAAEDELSAKALEDNHAAEQAHWRVDEWRRHGAGRAISILVKLLPAQLREVKFEEWCAELAWIDSRWQKTVYLIDLLSDIYKVARAAREGEKKGPA